MASLTFSETTLFRLAGKNQLSYDYLYRFDFSEQAYLKRKKLSNLNVHKFTLKKESREICLDINQEVKFNISLDSEFSLLEHLILKMILNIHSTLVMGKLGRYKNNLMTWVKPSNGKLIDRASRYVMHLLEYDGHVVSYEDVVNNLFKVMPEITSTDSIVLETYKFIKTNINMEF